jgi:CRISPR-associated endonuclease/helicase Cas3
MDEDISGRFPEFFEALWCYPPFAWQAALAERVLTKDDAPWPQTIALATAAGKTACIDIAVFALAAQAYRIGTEQPITAPRRIFFVVDRRIIVDEAFERARHLSEVLETSDAPIVREVAERLRFLARGPEGHDDDTVPLDVFELRGGMYRSEAWARSPLQPMVVASTVDQFGSRLLFRAYGRGSGMWPVYAGLTGNDSLILLDEAHCAKPFLQTLRAVAHYRTWAEEPLASPFCPVVLSATPPPEAADDVFRDESPEPHDPQHRLGKRQLAHKPARLVELNLPAKKLPLALAAALAEHAETLAHGPRKAVVIFCTRVATARETYRKLKGKSGQHAVLLTGRMRSLDKDRVVGEQLSRLASRNAARRELAEPIFVVATQTLEVGADLDFDALVTECASLDALRQRFGRLNRTGRAIEGIDEKGHPIGANAVIIGRADQVKPGADDPVYGLAIGGTWRELIKLADEDGIVDFGIAHFDADAMPQDPENQILAPSLDAPVMLPSHIDAWVQTSPGPIPVPEPALFLHGPERASADVRVCWRADIALDTADDVARAIDTLALVPPAMPETLPVPIGVMRRWLLGDNADQSSDIEGAADDAENGPDGTAIKRAVLRWVGGTGDSRQLKSPRELRPGDTLVIPADTGKEDALGDFGAAGDISECLDLGDEAFVCSRAKANLRIHPALIACWPLPDEDLRARWLICASSADTRFDDDLEALLEDLQALLADTAIATAAGNRNWFGEVIKHFAAAAKRPSKLKTLLLRHPSLTGLVLQGRKLLPGYLGGADRFTDEDDAQASGTVDVPLLPVEGDENAKVPKAHLPGVARFARRFAWGCSLPAAVAEAVERAGLLHDLGKLDPRFQCLLVGGNCWGVDPDRPLAKSMSVPRDRRARERARTAADYPKGARHELYSVALAVSDESGSLLPHAEPARSLILHLVASHHGHCRPFAPVIADAGVEPITISLGGTTLTHEGPTRLERLDSGVSDRFWEQVRRYGWWGSAWLEAIIRLADHRRSEYEQRNLKVTADD